MDAPDRVLQEAWFQAQGLERPPDDTLHPADDMARADVLEGENAAVRARMEYMRSGHAALTVLENVLAAAGRRLEDESALLDFACGHGRILRHLVQHLPADRIWASDVLETAVPFVRETFGVQAFLSTTDPDGVRFPRRFSSIFVGSLFSHLPRDTYEGFLRALYGALEPDGLLIYSTHTPEILAPAARAADGFTFAAESESHTLEKSDYGTTYVVPELAQEIGRAAGVAHQWVLEREIWKIQDVHVASPSPQPGLDAWRPAAQLHGYIGRADVSPEGQVWIGGWVRGPRHLGPVERVELVAPGGLRFDCASRVFDGPLPESDGGERFLQTDWYVEGPAAALGSGEHALCAVGSTAGGLRDAFDATLLRLP